MTTYSNKQQTTIKPNENESHNNGPGPQKGIKTKENPRSLCDDILINMKYLVHHSGLSDKHFYSLIKQGRFPRPIKLGRSSRWRKSEYEKWLADREKQR